MPERKVEKGIFEINDTCDDEAEIKSYKGEESVIEIPINDKKIIAIGKEVFEGNEYIEKVIAPYGVTCI